MVKNSEKILQGISSFSSSLGPVLKTYLLSIGPLHLDMCCTWLNCEVAGVYYIENRYIEIYEPSDICWAVSVLLGSMMLYQQEPAKSELWFNWNGLLKFRFYQVYVYIRITSSKIVVTLEGLDLRKRLNTLS